jgi:hypothetical protein
LELHFGSAIKHKQETIDQIFSRGDEGYDDNAKNGCDAGICGYREPN